MAIRTFRKGAVYTTKNGTHVIRSAHLAHSRGPVCAICHTRFDSFQCLKGPTGKTYCLAHYAAGAMKDAMDRYRMPI